MTKSSQKLGENFKNSQKSSLTQVLNCENRLEILREEVRPEFLSRKANSENQDGEIKLANWSIYHKQEEKTNLELGYWCQTHGKNREWLDGILKNQANDLDFEGTNWNIYLDQDGIASDKAFSHFASELVWYDMLLNTLDLTADLMEKRATDYKVRLLRQFKLVFNGGSEKGNGNYELHLLEKLSYKMVIEVLNRDFPEEMEKFKQYIKEIDDKKHDLELLTYQVIEPITEELNYKNGLLKTCTKEEASELKRQIKNLRSRRSKAEKGAIQKLKSKIIKLQNGLSTYKNRIMSVMMPAFVELYY